MSKKLTELEKRKLELEAAHKAELAKLSARVKKERARLGKAERKDDTRRKVLAGAAVLEWAKRDAEFSARLDGELGAFLIRNNERALFNLPPLKASADNPGQG